jgi:hypothetical protein
MLESDWVVFPTDQRRAQHLLNNLRALSDHRSWIGVRALTAISQATSGRIALIRFVKRGHNNLDYTRRQ